jgi:hypothetical protein
MAVLTHGDLPRGEMGGIISLVIWQNVCHVKKAPFCWRSGRFVHVLPRNLKWPATAFVQFAFRLSFRGKIASIYEMLQAKPTIALAPKTALNTASGDAGQESGNAAQASIR